VARAKTDIMPQTVLVSACLLGLHTRYDGTHCRRDEAAEKTRGCFVIPVCPEQLGGLPTPRSPATIESGDGRDVLRGASRVVNAGGEDVTDNYLRGARAVLEIARTCGARRAILKEKSPACGVACIKRDGADAPGMGVTAALLEQNGIELEGIA